MKHNPLSTLCLFIIMALAVTLMPPASAADVPIAAAKYRDDLTREARAAWGLEAPVALFAGQVHQESAWRETARSPVGAAGLAQVMPATAVWLADIYPDTLGNQAPYSPQWALRALVTYDRWLYRKVSGATECDRWGKALAGYNAGLGSVRKESRACDAEVCRVDKAGASRNIGARAAAESSGGGLGWTGLESGAARFARLGHAPTSAVRSQLVAHQPAMFGVAPLAFGGARQLRANLGGQRGWAAPNGVLSDRIFGGVGVRAAEEVVRGTLLPMQPVVLPVRANVQVHWQEVQPVFVNVVHEHAAGQRRTEQFLGDESMHVARAPVNRDGRVTVQEEYAPQVVQAYPAEHVKELAHMLADRDTAPHSASISACAKCNNARWFGNVEKVCRRAPRFCAETRDYVRRILLVHQARYAAWGTGVAC